MSMRTMALTVVLLLWGGGVNAAVSQGTCHIQYTVAGWSAIYQHALGNGRVTCSDGEHAAVRISLIGGGLDAGNSHTAGSGVIAPVSSIKDVFGNYAEKGASAGAVKSGTAELLTKGAIVLTLKPSGAGKSLGVPVETFSIAPNQ